MAGAGLQLPKPLASLCGKLLEHCQAGFADVLTWRPGRPMGKSGEPLC